MAFIYVVENQTNGKVYVGQTHFPDRREHEHFHRSSDCPALYAAMAKHGYENFEFVLLEKCDSQEKADDRERYWIDCLGSLVPHGYNLQEGGFGGKHSKETKQRLSIAHTGKKHSTAHKRANSMAHKGDKHHFYGKTTPEETRRKISVSLKGRKLSDEHRNKISNAMRGADNHQSGKKGYFTGRKHSEETKRKIREAALRRHRGM